MASPAPPPPPLPLINSLVIDAGPIIANTLTPTNLLTHASKIYTTPSILREIRDVAARARLETTWLPTLTLRTPKPENVQIVAEFAKKTGDYVALSVADLQLLGLVYELEVEINGGDWRLRRVPGQEKVNGPVPEEIVDGGEKINGTMPKVVVSEGEKINGTMPKVVVSEGEKNSGSMPKEAFGGEEKKKRRRRRGKKGVEGIVEGVEKVTISSEEGVTAQVEKEEREEDPKAKEEGEEKEKEKEDHDDNSSENDDYDDGEGDWITPSNIHKHKSASLPTTISSKLHKKPIAAALATTDFALQNVLLQMNLHLLSPTSLRRIKQVQTQILRCHACFKLTRDTTKQFCASCGGATLQRVSASTDSTTGKFTIHLKRNYTWNNRGNVYSIPKPQHGSASGKGVKKNLILREDQKEYERAVVETARRKERDLLDADYLPGILTGERDHGGGRPRIGYGRRNPNERRRGGGKKP